MTAVANPERRAHTTAIGIAFTVFIVLGLSSGLLGVAWPSMRDEFGLPLDAVGVLLLFQTSGYIISSAYSGRAMAQLGSGRAFLFGLVLMGIGLLGYGLAPAWPLVILCGLLNGLGGGLLDAGLNSYVALYYNSRQMNWLHACFGIGVTIGPVIMTQIVERDLSWRLGYGLTGLISFAMAAVFLVQLGIWRDTLPETSEHHPSRRATMLESLRQPLLWLSIALFFVYAGMEIGVGNWAYTLFTEGRGVSAEAAGYWVAVYWGSFTIGRIFFGALNVQGRVYLVLRLCMLASVLGAALFWLNFTEAVGFFGLALLGFAQAPLFPLLILKTGDRIGVEHAPNAVGLQVSAAGFGIAVLPGLAGKFAESNGLEVIAPFFFVLAVAVFVVHELSLWLRPSGGEKPKRKRVTADGEVLEVVDAPEA